MPVRAHLFVMFAGGHAALELAGDGFLFVDEQHHDMNRRLPEIYTQRGLIKLAPQRMHFIDQQLQALDLYLRAWETVKDRAVAIFAAEQLAQEQAHDLAVTHHIAMILEPPRLGRVEQGTDHDRLTGEAAGLLYKGCIGAFACAGRAAE